MVRTRSGRRVINLSYVPTNAAGHYVTFPIKGSIVVREKPLRLTYETFTLDGKARVLGEHPNDLQIGE